MITTARGYIVLAIWAIPTLTAEPKVSLHTARSGVWDLKLLSGYNYRTVLKCVLGQILSL
jgi:hypothetical protein